MIAAGATDLNLTILTAVESNLRVATCAFLASRFPVFPAGRDLFFRQVFKNSTFRPSVDEALSYPRAENLVSLLYHSPIGNPYAGMAPLRRHGGRDPPARGMDGFTFSFAAKYSRSIAAFVTRKLGAPPRFAIEVGSFLGAGATMTWGPLVKRGGGLLLCIDTWQGDLHMRLHPTNRFNPGYLRLDKGMPHLNEAFMQHVVDRNLSDVIYPLPMPSILGARLLATTAWLIDLIYIDSAHERGETLIEIHLYWQLLRPGGVLMGDDYREFPAVREDVQEFARCQAVEILFGKHETGSDNTWAILKSPHAKSTTPRGNLGGPGWG
jgi:hypothetical protein